MMTQEQRLALLSHAKAAKENAYAPYSGFKVGAAILDHAGKIHLGVNVENAAYPNGTCAEAGAISALILANSAEQGKISAIAVIGSGDDICTPCGGCRQRIREFAENLSIEIICANQDTSQYMSFTLNQLLPNSFGPDNLNHKQ